MSNRQRMQSDNPLFGQVNPEMASRRGNGGEPVSPAAVAASSTSSSTAHASAAAADPPPPDFVVTRAMQDKALKTAKETARVFGSWSKLSTKQQDTLYKKELTAIVAQAGESAAKAGESAAKAGESAAKADLAARDAADPKPAPLYLKLHQRFPTVTFGLVSRSATGLPPKLMWPNKVSELSGVEFAALPEMGDIVAFLMSDEAIQDFYPFEASRRIKAVLGKEIGIDRGFTILMDRVDQFVESNKSPENWYPFIYGVGEVAGQMDFGFSAAITVPQMATTSVAAVATAYTVAAPPVLRIGPLLVAGEFKPVTYNCNASLKGNKYRLYPTMSMDAKFEAEKVAANSARVDHQQDKSTKIVSPIAQLTDYMWVNAVFFGILSTYAHTWFFIRDCQGNLVIVESFPRHWCPEDGSMSVVQAIVVFLWLAKSGKIPQSLIEAKLLQKCAKGCTHKRAVTKGTKSGKPRGSGNGNGSNRKRTTDSKPPPSGPGRGTAKSGGNTHQYNTRSSGGGKNTRSTNTTINTSDNDDGEVQDPEDVSLFLYGVETGVYGKTKQEFLPSGRTGTTIRYRSDRGLDIVSKKADMYKQAYLKPELQHEASAYIKMRDLQGDVIPEFKGIGLDPRALFLYTLTTSHAGVPLCDVETVFEDEKVQAMAALKDVHAAGVLHGDIKAENIMVQRGDGDDKPGKVRILDFGCADLDDSDAEAFARATTHEQEELARMLEELPTAKAM